MARIRNSKSRNARTFFKKFSAYSMVLLLLASTNLTNAALANGRGDRNAAFEQFQMNNTGLDNKELRQMFRQEWQEQRQANKLDDIRENIQNNLPQNNVQNVVPQINAVQGLNKNDFATKAEFNAYKDALHDQKQIQNLKQSIQQIENNNIVKVNSGISLDLTSAVESITLGSNIFEEQASVTINVGGETKTVQAGSKVTAAEYIAAKQALTGTQSVHLDANGRATGGNVDLSALTTGRSDMKVDDLVVPVAVTAAGDFGKGGDVRIQGDLFNSGSIVAYSSNNSVKNAGIFADNITNAQTGNITSQLNDVAKNHGGVVSDLNLTLRANETFTNFGTIDSAGDLTVSAGRAINNAPSAVMSAQGNVDLSAQRLNNQGLVRSVSSNVTLNGIDGGDLAVNNYVGAIQANNGAINVRSADYAGIGDTTVHGGDLLSQQLNLNTGLGAIDVNVNDLTGVVKTNGTAAHVTANTDTLFIGDQCLTGDPVFYNTGDIVINGTNISVGEDLAIIAGGNITSTQSNLCHHGASR